jgi:hypothetical protein
MSDVFREVNEDLRREQLKQLWKRFGKYVIAGAVLIVVIVAGYQIYQSIQQGREAESGDRYQAAVDMYRNGDLDGAREAFTAIIGDGYGGYPTMARMAVANILAEQGDTTGAVQTFDQVANDGGADPALRDTARIRAAFLLADSASLAEIQQRVDQFNESGNPYRILALEVMAISAIAAGNYDQAGQWVVQMVQDPFANDTTNSRASVLYAYISAHLSAAASGAAAAASGAAAPEANAPAGFAAEAPAFNPAANPATATPEAAATTPGVDTLIPGADTLLPLLPGANPLAAPAAN